MGGEIEKKFVNFKGDDDERNKNKNKKKESKKKTIVFRGATMAMFSARYTSGFV